jgi:hypothetical protein
MTAMVKRFRGRYWPRLVYPDLPVAGATSAQTRGDPASTFTRAWARYDHDMLVYDAVREYRTNVALASLSAVVVSGMPIAWLRGRDADRLASWSYVVGSSVSRARFIFITNAMATDAMATEKAKTGQIDIAGLDKEKLLLALWENNTVASFFGGGRGMPFDPKPAPRALQGEIEYFCSRQIKRPGYPRRPCA